MVEEIPLPLHPLLREAAEITGLISPRTAGLALRYGIFIRSESWGERRLVVHELAHTAQYERLGGFQPFLEQYLYECIIPPGYPFGPLEQEAKRIERETCARNHTLQQTAASRSFHRRASSSTQISGD